MRKIVILCSLLFLVACGESKPKYKMYTPTDKYNMLMKVANENDTKLKTEIEKNIKLLKKAVENNDEKAKQELTEWQGLLLVTPAKIDI
ncbi:hypothetical protein EGX98_11025 [Fusobacterium necrophorum]|uniref:Lipoprotein n=2 Tax=Fusobacterium necrophorum TaxID=859 RepID=A0AB73BVN7_9FUSO|nr:hypothetical protein [Fusobacterium necrophorum]AYZ74512.1 hypothetical protein EGX98_11025 [Fusobacterium necrophorum]AZW09605.1 hypothetical protein EO219_08555 [Fusobacterium necrophorum subsp. necrophorum]KDE61568.1 hypothetical protein FUSO5_11625 [Fusobacterium necrophorum BFTR-1]KDE62670.1 hypothetical protein FUSO3_07290 [Fusobacterium necrophorum BL]KDE68300.1 hypothetical protein FUSO4_00830 [Fusobacterium necrophorum DJ-1]